MWQKYISLNLGVLYKSNTKLHTLTIAKKNTSRKSLECNIEVQQYILYPAARARGSNTSSSGFHALKYNLQEENDSCALTWTRPRSTSQLPVCMCDSTGPPYVRTPLYYKPQQYTCPYNLALVVCRQNFTKLFPWREIFVSWCGVEYCALQPDF